MRRRSKLPFYAGIRPKLIVRGLVAAYDFLPGADPRLLPNTIDPVTPGILGGGSGSDAPRPAWTAAGLQFDGVDDYVDLGYPDIFTDTGFTLEVLFRLERLTPPDSYCPLIGRYEGTGYTLTMYRGPTEVTEDLEFFLSGTPGITFAFPGIDVDSWHHVVVTYDGTIIRLYLDGNVAEKTILTGNPGFNLSFPEVLGSLWGSAFFPGTIAYYARYNRGLIGPEIKRNYLALLDLLDSRGAIDHVVYGAEAYPDLITVGPIGGGVGYRRIVTAGDYTVTTLVELTAALERAVSGEVIFIPETASIDLTGYHDGVVIPGGVTLASNRGQNGSHGGRIYQTRREDDPTDGWLCALKVGGENVRITGLRLEGPDKTSDSVTGPKNCIYTESSGLEVDNCEIWGWSWSGILARMSENVYVHHNDFHHGLTYAYGYGVTVHSGSTALVEANRFDYMEHCVAGSGMAGDAYEARYNHVLVHNSGDNTANSFDMHGGYTIDGVTIAGDYVLLHHNTVKITNNFAAQVQGAPLYGAYYTRNWVMHNTRGNDPNYEPFVQINSYGNLFVTNNLVGDEKIVWVNGPVMVLSSIGIDPSPLHTPFLYAIRDKQVAIGELLEFTVDGVDPDGKKLIFTTSVLPGGATFDPVTKTFHWKTEPGQDGTYPVTFTVSNGTNTDSETIIITIVK